MLSLWMEDLQVQKSRYINSQLAQTQIKEVGLSHSTLSVLIQVYHQQVPSGAVMSNFNLLETDLKPQ